MPPVLSDYLPCICGAFFMDRLMPKKPKPRPNRELSEAKRQAKDNLIRKFMRRDAAELDRMIQRAIDDEAYRNIQKTTGKDRHGVQRGKRTKKHPKGRGI